MIEQYQIVPMLLEVCPSFKATWEEHVEDNGKDLIYPALGDFGKHLLDLYNAGETSCFPDVAQVIERLHIEGTPFTKEAATIGILEGIQNIWGNNDADPEIFRAYLGKESSWYWQSLNDFWSGKVPYVGYRG